ncbi:MAG: hypothetical protein ACKN9K_11650, partial [Dolichospermum sp.]
LKGFKPGKTWVKLEFINNEGQPVKNVFNTTIRLINYQPNGQDTLSKIVRGELTADKVRGIVDQNYTVKTPVTQPSSTETPAPKTEQQSIHEVKPADVTETPAPKTEQQLNSTKALESNPNQLDTDSVPQTMGNIKSQIEK